MSISMERFEAAGQFVTYNPFASTPTRVAVFKLTCRCCGFEPEQTVVAPNYCPKCRGQSWERYARPGSILQNATRY